VFAPQVKHRLLRMSHDHYQCEPVWRHRTLLDLQSRLQAGW
jgi:hypothetical protein